MPSGMSTAASELQPPLPGTPFYPGPAGMAITAVVTGLLFRIAGLLPGNLRGPDPIVIPALAAGVASGCWCAVRVWSATLGAAFRGRGAAVALGSQVPFWFLGGGIGYCAGVVCLKAWGVIDIRDNPFQPVFFAGAWTGIIASALPAILNRHYSSIISRLRGAIPGKGVRHDKSGTAYHH